MVVSNNISGEPPPGYTEVLYWKISKKVSRVIIMNLLSIPLGILFGIGFIKFANNFGKPQEITI